MRPPSAPISAAVTAAVLLAALALVLVVAGGQLGFSDWAPPESNDGARTIRAPDGTRALPAVARRVPAGRRSAAPRRSARVAPAPPPRRPRPPARAPAPPPPPPPPPALESASPPHAPPGPPAPRAPGPVQGPAGGLAEATHVLTDRTVAGVAGLLGSVGGAG